MSPAQKRLLFRIAGGVLAVLVCLSALVPAVLSHRDGQGGSDSQDGQGGQDGGGEVQPGPDSGGEAPPATPSTIDYKLREDKSVYAADDPTSVVTMYLTVRPGNAAESTDHTWAEVNANSKYYYEGLGIDPYSVEAILQVGDENGPLEGELGYDAVVPNATVRVRGQTSTRNSQKNYKVELKDGMGTWRGQSTLNLNKHQGDSIRFSNKLAFDLMKDIPYMTACRTQFVHLYVKDETAGGRGRFEDYGLYTQVEQINKAYLKARGLDPNANLYKVEFFEYFQYPELRLTTDPDFDRDAFEDYLEIKGNDDHSRLLEMLEDVNDYSIPIEDTVEKWFDTENLFYWMGFHILMGNEDTQSRNYFLYSPRNIDKFYVLSWDCDASLKETEYLIKRDGFVPEGVWSYGISNYWGNVLYSRLFKNETYRDQLTAAIEDLRANYLTDEKVGAKVEAYRQVVKPYVYRQPDAAHAPIRSSQYETVADGLVSELTFNYDRYYQSLEEPMPFYLNTPAWSQDRTKLEFSWESAVDFDDEDITYSFTLAQDYTYTTKVIYQDDRVLIPEVTVDALPPGTYYVRVIATNESGYSKYAFDYIPDPRYSGTNIYGTKEFFVAEDGTITETVIVEGDS